jgi:hypothetical protein
MDDATILGGTLNQLGQTVKKAGQQAVKVPKELTRDADEQIEGKRKPAEEKKPDELDKLKQGGWSSDEERIMFLRRLYGYSKNYGEDNGNKLNELKDKKPSEFEEQIKDESPEEKMKLAGLRNQLHKENYYDPLVNPSRKQEERPAEKVEQEKKQEMQDLQQKEADKPPPLAVVKERNKAEMFRGAAG